MQHNPVYKIVIFRGKVYCPAVWLTSPTFVRCEWRNGDRDGDGMRIHWVKSMWRLILMREKWSPSFVNPQPILLRGLWDVLISASSAYGDANELFVAHGTSTDWTRCLLYQPLAQTALTRGVAARSHHCWLMQLLLTDRARPCSNGHVSTSLQVKM